MPFLVVIGVLDVLAALEPDLSVAMLYTLLMAILLFVGGVRIGHFIVLGIARDPRALARSRSGCSTRCCASPPSSTRANAPTRRATSSSSRSSPSAPAGCSASGSARDAAVRLRAVPVQRLRRQQHRRGVGLRRDRVVTIAFARTRCSASASRDRRARRFCSCVAVGLTFTTVLTAYLHIGVVIGLLPTTGLTLPFISLRPLEPRAVDVSSPAFS